MVININNLTKSFGELTAVDNLNLQVKEGEIFGLLGPNGSGKSTTINCILSLIGYDGSIDVFDKPMSANAYDIKRDIGVVLQEVAVFEDLTVRENIEYFCSLYIKDKETRKKYVQEAIDFVELGTHEKFFPKKLSGGLLRRLNIACGIVHKPKLIILDEPTVAVDPQSRNKILDGIVELNKGGATILYTSHYMEEVEQICDRMAIMDKGKIIAQGNIVELKSLINAGIKIVIETIEKEDNFVEEINKFDFVIDSKISDNVITVNAKKDCDAMIKILELATKLGIKPQKFYSELPTLNDVFLELTGKELRD